jgi:hypothetical protein
VTTAAGKLKVTLMQLAPDLDRSSWSHLGEESVQGQLRCFLPRQGRQKHALPPLAASDGERRSSFFGLLTGDGCALLKLAEGPVTGDTGRVETSTRVDGDSRAAAGAAGNRRIAGLLGGGGDAGGWAAVNVLVAAAAGVASGEGGGGGS